jgi:VanZ family protein
MMAAWQWLRRRPLLYGWVPLLGWMGLIFWLSAQPDLPHPDVGWWDLVFSSAAHAFVFGVLAALWMRVLGEHRLGWLVALALTMIYALSDEFHQLFVPGRYADPWDLLCDGAGAVIALVLWWAWQRR